MAEKQIGWRKIEKAAPNEFLYAGKWDRGKWYEMTGFKAGLTQLGFTHYLPIGLLKLPKDPTQRGAK